ncbi:hypothetical protein SKAU_G00274570 [Synaphobranchus kaupii]|uniref:Uncharacterized protein n=1 Tax=Synaphobranchus kaupii TaxID=118154 RepID=A0A9Q1INX1_SYNKA|nr:hypothetical protein SKAU_G00274570 [Synaphobranchus kaupii]
MPCKMQGEGTVKPQPPAMVGHVGGAKMGPEKEKRQKEGVLGRIGPPSRSRWGVPVSPMTTIQSRFWPTPKCYAGPSIDPLQVQGGRDMVLQTPGEEVVDVQMSQTPAGVGRPLDLPDAKGLTADQQQQFRGLIRQWAG